MQGEPKPLGHSNLKVVESETRKELEFEDLAWKPAKSLKGGSVSQIAQFFDARATTDDQTLTPLQTDLSATRKKQRHPPVSTCSLILTESNRRFATTTMPSSLQSVPGKVTEAREENREEPTSNARLASEHAEETEASNLASNNNLKQESSASEEKVALRKECNVLRDAISDLSEAIDTNETLSGETEGDLRVVREAMVEMKAELETIIATAQQQQQQQQPPQQHLQQETEIRSDAESYEKLGERTDGPEQTEQKQVILSEEETKEVLDMLIDGGANFERVRREEKATRFFLTTLVYAGFVVGVSLFILTLAMAVTTFGIAVVSLDRMPCNALFNSGEIGAAQSPRFQDLADTFIAQVRFADERGNVIFALLPSDGRVIETFETDPFGSNLRPPFAFPQDPTVDKLLMQLTLNGDVGSMDTLDVIVQLTAPQPKGGTDNLKKLLNNSVAVKRIGVPRKDSVSSYSFRASRSSPSAKGLDNWAHLIFVVRSDAQILDLENLKRLIWIHCKCVLDRSLLSGELTQVFDYEVKLELKNSRLTFDHPVKGTWNPEVVDPTSTTVRFGNECIVPLKGEFVWTNENQKGGSEWKAHVQDIYWNHKIRIHSKNDQK